MAKRQAPTEESFTQPPLTPFIDVIFQILIFFMVSMKVKITEGYIMTHLPEKATSQAGSMEKNSVRIYICCNGNLGEHRSNKVAHEDNLTGELGDIHVQVEEKTDTLVQLKRTTGVSARESIFKVNKDLAATIAEKAKNILIDLPANKGKDLKDMQVKLDIDSKVPTEHAVLIIDALKYLGIKDIQQVPNPKYLPSD